MSDFVRYLARLCCDSDDDDDDNARSMHHEHEDRFRPRGRNLGVVTAPILVESSIMSSRHNHAPSAAHNYQQLAASQSQDENDHDDEEEEEEDDERGQDCCCRHSKCDGVAPNDHGLHDFFQKLRERWRRYDSMETFRRPVAKMNAGFHGMSPLRTASSFDNSLDIPTIHMEEVVLPGSELQQQMARTMSLNLEAQGDECVICMEGFDPTNPRMPTLCGCGQNRTYFHLPCLYQWMEQSEECPSCRQPLRWEEL